MDSKGPKSRPYSEKPESDLVQAANCGNGRIGKSTGTVIYNLCGLLLRGLNRLHLLKQHFLFLHTVAAFKSTVSSGK